MRIMIQLCQKNYLIVLEDYDVTIINELFNST